MYNIAIIINKAEFINILNELGEIEIVLLIPIEESFKDLSSNKFTIHDDIR